MKNIASSLNFDKLIILLLLLAVLVPPKDIFSQGYYKTEINIPKSAVANHEADRWFFGKYAGLDFRPQNPVADLTNDSININTSPAIMSDDAGNILFYTNSRRIFDRFGNRMPNGFGLHGMDGMTMPVLIIPKPGSDSIYYIFTTHRPKMDPNDIGTIYGFEYNVVNMNLNGGLGDITLKNQVLLEPEISSKLSAVKHSNGIDYWVVVHKFNSDEFCSFRVTSDGVDTTDYVSSHIGAFHAAPGVTNDEIGYMKISPDGTKLALAIYGSNIFEIYDFNASTGTVTNVVTSPEIFQYAFGVEFSPDSRFFYGSTTPINFPNLYDTITEFSCILKFDVSLGNSIFNSYDTIALDTLGSYYGGIQLGTDSRIYVSRSPFGNASLSVIQNPKRPGKACNFVSNAIDLQGRQSRFGLPNFIQSYFDLPHFDVENTFYSDNAVFTLQNDSFTDDVSWQFGDPQSSSNTSTDMQPSHVFSGPGSYQVQVTEYYNGKVYGPYYETVVVNSPNQINEGNEHRPFYSIYPNPGDGTLHLLFNPGTNKAVVSATNLAGQTIWGPCHYSDLEIIGEVVLNLNDLAKGVYFIHVKDENRVSFPMKYLLLK